jgi:hypothetical protein
MASVDKRMATSVWPGLCRQRLSSGYESLAGLKGLKGLKGLNLLGWQWTGFFCLSASWVPLTNAHPQSSRSATSAPSTTLHSCILLHTSLPSLLQISIDLRASLIPIVPCLQRWLDCASSLLLSSCCLRSIGIRFLSAVRYVHAPSHQPLGAGKKKKVRSPRVRTSDILLCCWAAACFMYLHVRPSSITKQG